MIGNKIRALLNLSNKKTEEACECLGILQPAYSRKINKNTFKTEELIKLAELTNTKLAYVNNEGKVIVEFDIEDIKKEPTHD